MIRVWERIVEISMPQPGGDYTLAGVIGGGTVAGSRAAITLGMSIETIYYACIGAGAGYIFVETIKYIRKTINNKLKKDGKGN